MVYPVHISDQKFKHCVNLLMTTNENKSHYVYINDFNRSMCNKTNCRTKKHFCRYFLQFFSSERVLIEYKETCFKTNNKQTVKLKRGSIKFKNNYKQLAAPFKIYVGSECVLKRVKSNKTTILYMRKISST